MAGFKYETRIEAPPEDVFRAASDVRGWPEAISGITGVEVLTEGPIGLGTRFRETRVMFGRPATEEMEFLAFDPPRSYLVGCDSHGCRYRSLFSFEAEEGGTRVEMEFEAVPLTFMAKIMSFIMKPMMKSMHKIMRQDLEDLKAAIEARQG